MGLDRYYMGEYVVFNFCLLNTEGRWWQFVLEVVSKRYYPWSTNIRISYIMIFIFVNITVLDGAKSSVHRVVVKDQVNNIILVSMMVWRLRPDYFLSFVYHYICWLVSIYSAILFEIFLFLTRCNSHRMRGLQLGMWHSWGHSYVPLRHWGLLGLGLEIGLQSHENFLVPLFFI